MTKLAFLNSLSSLFGSYEIIFSLRRIDDNLFRLTLDNEDFYLDLSKGKSCVFVSQERIWGNSYKAPFDLALSKYCSRAKLLSCTLDGHNQILIFEFLYLAAYKKERYFLHFELTGKHTNVILVDERQKVIEALRHLGENKSMRVIKPQKLFTPLPQPQRQYSLTPLLHPSEVKAILLQNYKDRQSIQIAQKKATLIANKQKKIKDLHSKLQALPQSSYLSQEVDKYVLWGELIFASKLPAYFLNPFVLKDYEGCDVEILLPPKIHSYSQAGNFCFAQSKKYRQKLENLKIQSHYLCSKIDFLQKEIIYIEGIMSERELQIFLPQKQGKKNKSQKHYESFFIDGIKVSIGKNERENQRLLEDARADDLWLHIQGIPSSHMIIHCGKAKLREEILQESAKILLGMSGICDKNVLVDYTQRRYVKIVEGANVVYAKQKTLRF